MSGMMPIALFPRTGAPAERASNVGREAYLPLHGGTFVNVTEPALYPRLVPGALSAVIILPGGAYNALTWVLEGESAARWLNSVGISAYILKYRVPGRAWLPFGHAPFIDLQASGTAAVAPPAPLPYRPWP